MLEVFYMAFDFTKGFNKFVETNNQLNHVVNNLIDKDVFPAAKKLKRPAILRTTKAFHLILYWSLHNGNLRRTKQKNFQFNETSLKSPQP